MLTTIYSVGFLTVCLVVAVVSVRRPRIGLLFVVAVSPFYTMLRESSTGSAVFFVWPYFLTGVLVLVITARELIQELERRGVQRPTLWVAGAATGLAAVALGAGELAVGAVSALFADSGLSSLRPLLGDRPLGWALACATLLSLMFFPVLLVALWRRDGRTLLIDLVMVAFVAWGVLQVLNTYWLGGRIFTGLDGFRYYFIGAMTYFPARYLLESERERRVVVSLVGAVCLVAALELFVESLLLNVLAIEPHSIPWLGGGYLANEFGYTPDPGRPFFEGRYVPPGFMFQSHTSGLFVLLGFALWWPRALIARTRLTVAVGAAVLLFLVTNTIWTSRTGLMLGMIVSLVGVGVTGAGWRRSLGWLAGLAVAAPLASTLLIPGARFDLGGQLAYLGGQAIPNLARAIGYDVAQITGWNPYPSLIRLTQYIPPWARPPDGWTVVTGELRYGVEEVRSAQRSIKLLPDGPAGAELRYQLPVEVVKGQKVEAVAWVKTAANRELRLQLHDGNHGQVSTHHSGSDEWELLSTELQVGDDPQAFVLDVDLEGTGVAYVDAVAVRVDGRVMSVLGPDIVSDLVALFPTDDALPSTEDTLVAALPTEESDVLPDGALSPILDLEALEPELEVDSESAQGRPRRPMVVSLLFGQGATYGGWSRVFFGNPGSDGGDVFRAASYSDTKLLEFAEQFGLIGLGLLLLTGGLGLRAAWRATRGVAAVSRVNYIGVSLMVLVGYSALLHLPVLFRVGYGTVVFALLGILASAEAAASKGNGGAVPT